MTVFQIYLTRNKYYSKNNYKMFIHNSNYGGLGCNSFSLGNWGHLLPMTDGACRRCLVTALPYTS